MSDISGKKIILVADDDMDDKGMIKEAVNRNNLPVDLSFVDDGEQLVEHLATLHLTPDAVMPSLILLDLNMPKKDGREALKEIKANPAYNNIPVIIFTTSKSQKDIVDCYNLGCNCYISKPPTYSGLVNVIKSIFTFWFEVAHL